MSFAFFAGRTLGGFRKRLGRRLDEKWQQARVAFEDGLRGDMDGTRLSRRQLEELYGRLELPPGADAAAIDRAWRRLVRVYHPDRFANDPDRFARATRLVAALNDARTELKRHLGARP
ncbi:MAG: DnaJ domain-containing protein [Acidobacteriota bacterium]